MQQPEPHVGEADREQEALFTQTGRQGPGGGWGSGQGGPECQAKERGLHGGGRGRPSATFEQGGDRGCAVGRKVGLGEYDGGQRLGVGDQERWSRAGAQGPRKGSDGNRAQGPWTRVPGPRPQACQPAGPGGTLC